MKNTIIKRLSLLLALTMLLSLVLTGCGGGDAAPAASTASLPLAYKIAHFFGLTIEEVFDFSDLED